MASQSLSSAASLPRSNTTRPNITFAYSEPVLLRHVSLKDAGADSYLVLNKSSLDMKTLWFWPKSHLKNGNYTLSVIVSDLVDNSRTTHYDFELVAPFMSISIIRPPLGASRSTNFTLVVETENRAHCLFSMVRDTPYDVCIHGFNYSTDFNFNQQHVIYNFNMNSFGPTSIGEEKRMYIKCNESGSNRIHSAVLRLTYDKTAPTLSAYAVPSQVSDPANRTTTIIAETDDDTICTLTPANTQEILRFEPYDENDREAYTKRHAILVDYSSIRDTSPHTFNYNVVCKNLIGDVTVSPVSVNVWFSGDFSIDLVSPGLYARLTTFNLEFRTSVNAYCIFRNKNSSFYYDFSVSNGRTHKTTMTNVAKGEHNLVVNCTTSLSNRVKDFKIIVDSDKPSITNISSPSPTCSLSEISADFAASDSGGSRIRGYNYTLRTGGYILRKAFTTSSSATVTIALNQTRIYKWEAVAVDNAGNIGPIGTSKDIKVVPETAHRCDTTLPHGWLFINQTRDISYVTVKCTDSGSGCTEDYQFCFPPDNSGTAACTYNTRTYSGGPIPVMSNSLIRFKVRDIANNTYNGSKLVEVLKFSINCSNGVHDGNETDVDCGGNCLPCGVNKKCNEDSDCLSNDCTDGICHSASCSNSKKDGFETDVDCGGGVCEKCADGKSCSSSYDCVTGYCDPLTLLCIAPSCTDNVKNGLETDVDCGGSCSKCDNSKKCSSNADCSSGFCNPTTKVCASPSCSDGFKNGDETAADCGGSCGPCPLGMPCFENTDCESGKCEDNLCIEKPVKLLPLLLLAIGVILFFGGGVYIYLTVKSKKKAAAEAASRQIMTHGTQQRPGGLRGPGSPDPAIQARRRMLEQKKMAEQRLARERLMKKQKQRASVFTAFEPEGSGRKVSEADASAKKKQPEDSGYIVDESESEDGFVDLSAIKKAPSKPSGRSREKGDSLESDVFQKLSLVVEKKVDEGMKNKSGASAGQAGSADAGEESASEIFSKLEKIGSKKEFGSKDVFAELSKITGVSQKDVKGVFESKKEKTEKRKDIIDIFANVTDRKQLNEDVFKLMLKQLLDKGILTKQNVSDLLFDYQDKDVITKGEVYEIMKSLGLIK